MVYRVRPKSYLGRPEIGGMDSVDNKRDRGVESLKVGFIGKRLPLPESTNKRFKNRSQ